MQTVTSELESCQRTFDLALRDAKLEPALLNRLGNPKSDAVQRIGLYRGNLRTRWRAALANAYPVLSALVGDAYFDTLAHAYAREHPSQSGDLNGFGASMSGFIETYEPDSRFRYFADVARLEWSLHVAYFAADVIPFTPQQWSEIGSDALLNSPLVVHPACSAIASQYAIADIWRAHQSEGGFPECVDVRAWTLVVRPLWKPTIIVHSASAHAAFVSLQQGQTLDEALDVACEIDPDFDIAAQLQTWIATSAIIGAAI